MTKKNEEQETEQAQGEDAPGITITPETLAITQYFADVGKDELDLVRQILATAEVSSMLDEAEKKILVGQFQLRLRQAIAALE